MKRLEEKADGKRPDASRGDDNLGGGVFDPKNASNKSRSKPIRRRPPHGEGTSDGTRRRPGGRETTGCHLTPVRTATVRRTGGAACSWGTCRGGVPCGAGGVLRGAAAVGAVHGVGPPGIRTGDATGPSDRAAGNTIAASESYLRPHLRSSRRESQQPRQRNDPRGRQRPPGSLLRDSRCDDAEWVK